MAPLRPRLIGLLALLALVPVGYYMQATARPVVWASLACVLLVAGSLYVLFGPAEADPASH